ncbi:MAG TPA: LuxR C-terminal-related transcriptional regulator [Gaiellaceae bacterium]|nr:LuxR C-terminal-related transcriptional regulator [Gaiellaceae bacterium]
MDELEQGRAAYARRSWKEAHESLTRADEAGALGAPDLELLAVSAYMLGRDDEAWALLERAHHAYLDAGETLPAVRCAFHIGLNLSLRGETGPGGGWLGRAQRLLDRERRECAEHGYMLLPVALRQEAAGDWEAATATAARMAAIGERFADDDLFALGAFTQGRFMVVHRRMADGLRLLDEAMVAATSQAGLPIVTGIVYCGVVLTCVETYDVRRAQEWTEVLTRWCEQQQDLVAFTGRCLVHRAEIMQLRGDWGDALAEAQRASERLVAGLNRPATAQAFYRQGELHRLRGDFDAADEAFRAAVRHGLEPQPGLALLRLQQGRADTAAAAIGRVLGETVDRPGRAGLLAAAVEIRLGRDERADARAACVELQELADEYGSEFLAAAAAHARGAVLLAEGELADALVALRRAARGWQELEAPYEGARTRALIALACRALGDGDSATQELEAARDTFAELGAAPDVARVDALLAGGVPGALGLTSRELEVLRLVAKGSSNREIAGALVISEHTVARHVQNIFAKLGVSSRTAAGAFAHEHHLA